MNRVADSTIKGFLYQFNLTLKYILESEDEVIQVEGSIEDIDIHKEELLTAVQCKYHESKRDYTLARIYEPVLQMIRHYTENKKNGLRLNTKYKLYAHFPDLKEGKKTLSENDLENMLGTKNSEYISRYTSYLRKCDNEKINEILKKDKKTKDEKKVLVEYFSSQELNLVDELDLSDFLNNHFEFEIGLSIEKIEEDACKLLVDKTKTLSKKDVKEIFYPNAIQKIAVMSSEVDPEKRKITRQVFVSEIQRLKTTAITRWTRELTSYRLLLQARREQLSTKLNINHRKRYFVFDSKEINDFDQEIVMFIKDYTSKYCSKSKLHYPATICILDYDKEQIDNLLSRLYERGVIARDGYCGSEFFEDLFTKDPVTITKDDWFEYTIRICNGDDKIYKILNRNKPDDFFMLCKRSREFDYTDVNVEDIEVKEISDLRYLLKI